MREMSNNTLHIRTRRGGWATYCGLTDKQASDRLETAKRPAHVERSGRTVGESWKAVDDSGPRDGFQYGRLKWLWWFEMQVPLITLTPMQHNLLNDALNLEGPKSSTFDLRKQLAVGRLVYANDALRRVLRDLADKPPTGSGDIGARVAKRLLERIESHD